MHDFTMPQWAIDRVMQRRGKLHIFDDIDPRRTALVVVDLQNGFMVPEYTPMPVKTSLGTVPNVNRLAAALRETGGRVFWIKNTTNDTSLKEWSNWFAMSRKEVLQERIETFKAGAPGHEIYPRAGGYARGRNRVQIPLQRLHPGFVGFAGTSQGPRL
jgi:ureidoacrylate peracid hydrolase